MKKKRKKEEVKEEDYLGLSRGNGNTFSATLLSFIGNEGTNVKSNFYRAILRCFHRKRKKKKEKEKEKIEGITEEVVNRSGETSVNVCLSD